jgi:hypothetical protein
MGFARLNRGTAGVSGKPTTMRAPRENRCVCLHMTLRSPLVSVWGYATSVARTSRKRVLSYR